MTDIEINNTSLEGGISQAYNPAPTKDYGALHEERIAAIKQKLLGSRIVDTLQVKAISNNRLEIIKTKMEELIAPNKVYDDFNYRTGRIMGIIRAIVHNGKFRDQLLEITGLTNDQVNLYYELIGNMPYTKEGIIVYGHAMRADEARDYIMLCGYQMGIVVEEGDLYDITQERCDTLYNKRLVEEVESLKQTQKIADQIPEQYDE